MPSSKCHLLHVCCAPDLVISHLAGARGDVFFYNPNIAPAEEHEKRLSEVRRTSEFFSYQLVSVAYEPEVFEAYASGLEEEPEGGTRCARCIEMRLAKTAQIASELGYRSFSTTLTASPKKNVGLINALGKKVAEEFGVDYLPNVYRKTPLFGDAQRLVKQLGIYRQRYCGCIYSLKTGESTEENRKFAKR